MSQTIQLLLQVALGLGVPSLLAGLVLRALKPIQVHSRFAVLDSIADAIGNGAESVVRGMLTAGDLQKVAEALAQGSSVKDALGGLLPLLSQQVQAQLHPDMQARAVAEFGSGAHAAAVQSAVIGAARDLATLNHRS